MKGSSTTRVGLASLLLAAALSAQAQQGVDQAVQDLADRWTEAYNSHDRSVLSELYTEDARLMLHGSPTIVGRDDIEDFWAEDFQEGNPLTVLSVTHSVNGADMILVHGNYEVIDRDSGIILGKGRFAHIWNQSEDGGWRLDRDLWNEPFEPYR